MAYRHKVAIVTGGASGIGRAMGQQLAEQGAVVILADINSDLVKETAAGIAERGGKAFPVVLDVTDAAAVQKVVDDTVAAHGRLDFMFNNAGIVFFGEIRHMDLAMWRRIIDVNLLGVLHGVAAAYPRMLEQGEGHIVNTASLAGILPSPLATAYSTTKHAVVGLSTSLRAEAADLGVRVSVVCPGFIDTPIKDSLTYLELDKQKMLDGSPLKLHSADDCARVILKGVARNKPVITVTAFAGFMWRLYRFLPSLSLWLIRLSAREGRRKFSTRAG